MHLVPCNPPKGALDRAPRTSLRENSASETWDGFWADERYLARCTRSDGSVQWYHFAADRSRPALADTAAKILPLRRGRSRMMLVGSRNSAILIGTSRRRSRPSVGRRGGAR